MTKKVYKPSEISRVPKGAILDNSYWHYFLLLEEDFKKTLRYVQLDDSNMKTYSLEFAKQLILISAEFETIAQLLCKQINGTDAGNMGEYKSTILTKFPKIWSTQIFLDQYNQMEILPLLSWSKPGGKLSWWDAYTHIKHRRHLNFKSATLEHTLNALGSLLILESYLYRLAYPTPDSIRIGTSLIRIPGMGEPMYLDKGTLPDFS